MTEIRLKSTVLVVLAFFGTHGGATRNNRPQESVRNFVVQIKHMQLDLRPHGGTASTCVLVLPDLKIHIEKRIQHLPERAAKLSVSESTLTSDQMQQLRNILDSEQIKALPYFEFKREYAGEEGFEGYQAKILRDKGVQVVGYMNPGITTDSRGTSNSPPESLRRRWSAAQEALTPLVRWADGVTTNLPAGQGRSSLCEVER